MLNDVSASVVGMADEHARRAVAVSPARAADHDIRHHAGAVFHGLRLPRLLHCPSLPCFSGNCT